MCSATPSFPPLRFWLSRLVETYSGVHIPPNKPIIIEQVFTIPGIGRLLLASISNRDFPVVQAVVVILAAWIVVVNFLADLLNQWTDPRVRLR